MDIGLIVVQLFGVAATIGIIAMIRVMVLEEPRGYPWRNITELFHSKVGAYTVKRNWLSQLKEVGIYIELRSGGQIGRAYTSRMNKKETMECIQRITGVPVEDISFRNEDLYFLPKKPFRDQVPVII